MKLRVRPEDFAVEEISSLAPGRGRRRGAFALYRLEKRSLTTLDALVAVGKAWRIPATRIAHAGLKDRHAVTRQLVTIAGGPPRDLELAGLKLEYLGAVARATRASDIVGNRFRIVARALDAAECVLVTQNLPIIERDGLPNYFDDQRFGSLSGGELPGRAACAGRLETALRLTLVADAEGVSRRRRKESARLDDLWGDWQAAAKLPLPPWRARIVAHLAENQRDFRGAFRLVPQALRRLQVSAWQSQVWNEWVAAIVRHAGVAAARPLQVAIWELPCWGKLPAAKRTWLQALRLPLPTRSMGRVPAELSARFAEALARLGARHAELAPAGRDTEGDSRSWRAVAIAPFLKVDQRPDELHPGLVAAQLEMTLPRGSFATMVVKRLFHPA